MRTVIFLNAIQRINFCSPEQSQRIPASGISSLDLHPQFDGCFPAIKTAYSIYKSFVALCSFDMTIFTVG